MRKTLFLLLCMLVGFGAFSKTTDSREIDLRAKQSDQEALRSILPVRASLDGNTLLVEFFNSPQEVTVKISNLENQEVVTIGKPVQLLPYYNFSDKHDVYKKNSILTSRNILEYLTEISIHVDQSTNITNILPFLQSLPGNITFNIVGNLSDVANYKDLLSFFDLHDSPKKLCCSSSDVISLQSISKSSFSYIISIHFPIDVKKWNRSIQLLVEKSLPVTYIFDVLSLDDCQQAEELVEQFQIENYRLNPVYTEDNIVFFKQNVFLTKKDILSSSISIKTFFANQSINIHDFGKISIMPNGDSYANLNYPTLGNINTHSIHEIVDKEIKEGMSWFRIRNQAPCNESVYQWLCPSPSNYEISIDKPNLCHVKTITNQYKWEK